MRILLVGLGSIGARHAANLRSLGVTELLALRSGTQPTRETPDGIRSCERLEDALSWRPDAALITNPTALHVPIALQLAGAGCHLFIEKPLSNSLTGVQQLADLAKQRGLVALVGFNLRFHPALLKVREILSGGSLGALLAVRAHVGQYLPEWRPDQDYRAGYGASKALGGGVILDLIHELDYVIWLAGTVTSVFCLADHVSSLSTETEDVAEISLRLARGAIASVHLDCLDRALVRTSRFVLEEGSVECDLISNEVRVFRAPERVWSTVHTGDADRNAMYVAEMRHFLACLRGEVEPVVGLEHAATVLTIALAAKESALSGCQVAINSNGEAA